MSLPCALRGLGKKLLASHLKPNVAILSSSLRSHHTFGHQGIISEPQIPGQSGLGVRQQSLRNQLPSICFQPVNNFSLSQKRYSGASHDHGKLWGAERILSVSLLASVPAALMYPSQALDCVLALSMVLHSHWGLEACVIDYVRPIIFGPVIPKVALGVLYLLSISTLAGLFYLIFNDMGLANAVLKFWKL